MLQLEQYPSRATGKNHLSRGFFLLYTYCNFLQQGISMTCGSYLIDRLHQRGFRMTPQRMAILHTLRHSGGHLSPIEVYNLTRRVQSGLTEATVYRTLEFLAENGFALAAHVGGGKLVYELTEENHHHVICRKCGKIIAVESAALTGLYEQLDASTGFKLDSSHVTLFGLCPECQSNSQTEE